MEIVVNGRDYWISAWGGDLSLAHFYPCNVSRDPRKRIKDSEIVPVYMKVNNQKGKLFRGFAFRKDKFLYEQAVRSFASPRNSVGGRACSVSFETLPEEWVVYSRCEPGYGTADLELPPTIPEPALIARWGLQEEYEQWLRE